MLLPTRSPVATWRHTAEMQTGTLCPWAASRNADVCTSVSSKQGPLLARNPRFPDFWLSISILHVRIHIGLCDFHAGLSEIEASRGPSREVRCQASDHSDAIDARRQVQKLYVLVLEVATVMDLPTTGVFTLFNTTHHDCELF